MIRLRECPGWSGSMLVANALDFVVTRLNAVFGLFYYKTDEPDIEIYNAYKMP
jgi:hypothetical protein